jgi:hypothetical protein
MFRLEKIREAYLPMQALFSIQHVRIKHPIHDWTIPLKIKYNKST